MTRREDAAADASRDGFRVTLKPKAFEVSTCAPGMCPFVIYWWSGGDSGHECGHFDRDGLNITWDEPPDRCPLRKQPALVRLEEKSGGRNCPGAGKRVKDEDEGVVICPDCDVELNAVEGTCEFVTPGEYYTAVVPPHTGGKE